MWYYWVSWSHFKHQSFKKSIQSSGLVRAGDMTRLFARSQSEGPKTRLKAWTIMFATARTWPGILPGTQAACLQEVLIRVEEITWHGCQYAGTRHVTMDWPQWARSSPQMVTSTWVKGWPTNPTMLDWDQTSINRWTEWWGRAGEGLLSNILTKV